MFKKFGQYLFKNTSRNMVGITNNSVNHSVVHNNSTPFQTATFGMGCFWGADCLFGATSGVLRTKVGYSGGTKMNPMYRDLGDHTEVISIDYDPTRISYEQLLDLFWNNHEYGLTKRMKRQYMSLILTHSTEQQEIANKSRAAEQVKRTPEVIITEIATAEEFYPAEDYHQKYRLQSHKALCETLGLNPGLLQTSHVAAKLNGYLVGVGGVKQFLAEADSLGLNDSQKEYVRHHVETNEGGGLFC